tara:strand:+ start:2239 stop:2445 length:207 start_codon:yes stop_codon:yes gene_type:complete
MKKFPTYNFICEGKVTRTYKISVPENSQLDYFEAMAEAERQFISDVNPDKPYKKTIKVILDISRKKNG